MQKLLITIIIIIVNMAMAQCLKQEETFQCPSPYGTFANTNDCSKYWQCINGQPYARMCPPGMHWNEKVGRCTDQFFANCKIQ